MKKCQLNDIVQGGDVHSITGIQLLIIVLNILPFWIIQIGERGWVFTDVIIALMFILVLANGIFIIRNNHVDSNGPEKFVVKHKVKIYRAILTFVIILWVGNFLALLVSPEHLGVVLGIITNSVILLFLMYRIIRLRKGVTKE